MYTGNYADRLATIYIESTSFNPDLKLLRCLWIGHAIGFCAVKKNAVVEGFEAYCQIQFEFI